MLPHGISNDVLAVSMAPVMAMAAVATTVPALPDDILRMIWAKVWQLDAACVIQRAVRAAIARADGDPWDLRDLPQLVDVWYRSDGYDSEEELALFFYSAEA